MLKNKGLKTFIFSPDLASGRGEIRTLGTELPVRRFSKPLVSATHPPFR